MFIIQVDSWQEALKYQLAELVFTIGLVGIIFLVVKRVMK